MLRTIRVSQVVRGGVKAADIHSSTTVVAAAGGGPHDSAIVAAAVLVSTAARDEVAIVGRAGGLLQAPACQSTVLSACHICVPCH